MPIQAQSLAISQKNRQMKNTIPTWISIVAGLMAALGLFVGASLYISPGTFVPDIDFSDSGIQFLTQMWAARQIAIAGIIAYSLLRKSVPMLTISLIAYVLMNIQDAIIGFSRNDMGLLFGALFFGSLAATMAFTLGRK